MASNKRCWEHPDRRCDNRAADRYIARLRRFRHVWARQPPV